MKTDCEIELEPCPFCGGKAKMIASRPGIEGRICHVARCAVPFCIGGSINIWQTTPERAAMVWNRRANCGNAAAMRNALVKVRTYLLRSPYAVDEDGVMADVVDALAAPVRNCDRFNSVLEAAKAFAAEYQKQPHPCPDFIFSRWLLATAAERKGDGNGR